MECNRGGEGRWALWGAQFRPHLPISGGMSFDNGRQEEGESALTSHRGPAEIQHSPFPKGIIHFIFQHKHRHFIQDPLPNEFRPYWSLIAEL